MIPLPGFWQTTGTAENKTAVQKEEEPEERIG